MKKLNDWGLGSLKLGDKIASVTDALGIPQCGGCKKRQNYLNNMFTNKPCKNCGQYVLFK